jgi:hypothetical protein
MMETRNEGAWTITANHSWSVGHGGVVLGGIFFLSFSLSSSAHGINLKSCSKYTSRTQRGYSPLVTVFAFVLIWFCLFKALFFVVPFSGPFCDLPVKVLGVALRLYV